MANPYVTIGNYEYEPAAPSIVRNYFTKVSWADNEFYLYAPQAYVDPEFTPQGEGNCYALPLGDLSLQPTFVTDNAWGALGPNGMGQGPSVFVSGADTLMPKIMVPSKLLVDNGLPVSDVNSSEGGLFEWSIADPKINLNSGGMENAKFVSLKSKDDKVSANNVYEMIVTSNENYVPFADNDTGEYETGADLVGTGAFAIVMNVVKNKCGTDSNGVLEDNWKVKIDTTSHLGDLIMTIDDTGSMLVELTGDGEGQITKAQLADSAAKEQPPQANGFSKPTIIVVYPVWNGVVVSSGIQDTRNTVKIASQYCIKLKQAHVLLEPWSEGFDSEAALEDPDEYSVEVSVGSGSSDVRVLNKWTGGFTVTAYNCRGEFAYVPLFHTDAGTFDLYKLIRKDNSTITYNQHIFPIWSKNGTDYNLDTYIDDTYEKEIADSMVYKRLVWDNFNESFLPSRRASEVFGYIYHVEETIDYDSVNGNGRFPLWNFWSNSDVGDPDYTGGWVDYIQSISVTRNLDGSTSGQITIDKYGCSGQTSTAVQSIGSLTLDMRGVGSRVGRIFTGIGMGIGEMDSSDGSSWNIPLVGLEKKMEDIVLINAPFFDGYKLGDFIDFICDYTGMDKDTSRADLDVRLKASTDISTPIVDFKSGTPALDALNQVMEMTLHSYVIHENGKIYFYELSSSDALPVNLGTNWSFVYPNVQFYMNKDVTPDFEDLRNEIVMMGLLEIKQDTTEIKDLPIQPIIGYKSHSTSPEIPWSKPMVYPMAGFVNEEILNEQYQKIKPFTTRYEVQGKLTVSGNAHIRIYDTWYFGGKQYVITSVTHNADFSAKTWTTDVDFAIGR